MATQSQIPSSEAPGGEMLAGKSTGEGVALGLSQGLPGSSLSKAELKKQRKQAKSQPQSQQQQQQQQQSSSLHAQGQHYQAKDINKQQESTLGLIKAPSSSSSATKGQQVLQKEQRPASSPLQQLESDISKQQKDLQKESPILPGTYSSSSRQTKPSLEPPLLSPGEQSRQWKARKEVEQLEEKERQDRIAREKRENLPAMARKAARLVGDLYQSESLEQEVKRREGEREASLMGTVIDEEQERQRRIEEDYPTYTEPLEKTKGLEEIERSRRMQSLAEKPRQMLAAESSAKLFPNAPRPQLAQSKLWTSQGHLRRESGSTIPSLTSSSKKKLPSDRSDTFPRYGEFVTTTTKTSMGPHPTLLQAKPFIMSGTGLPVSKISAVSEGSSAKLTAFETGNVVKICKDTYRAQNRPRLVVYHEGLVGRWKRASETIELHEGVDF